MSINSKMKPYHLYVNEPVLDQYNNRVDNYIFVGEVMAFIAFVSSARAAQDIRYKDCQYIGLSKTKGLDLSKEYKLIPKEEMKPEYLIKSINEFTRLAQYLL